MVRSIVALALLPMLSHAAEPEALQQRAESALAKLLPNAKIDQVRPSAVDGMLELVVSGHVLYLTADGKHLFQGTVFDTQRASNLTELTLTDIRKDGIAALPDGAKIRFAPKASTHEVTVFTAIDCGYCRRFHQDIGSYLDAGIAVNYVLIPLGGPGSAADQASKQVYCSADRAQAFTAATLGQPLEARAECPSHYADGIDLATRLGISTTPTLVSPGGQILGGYVSAKELLAKLDAVGGR